jgi:hypothetical protein
VSSQRIACQVGGALRRVRAQRRHPQYRLAQAAGTSWPPTNAGGNSQASPPLRRSSASSAARPRSTAATWGRGAAFPPMTRPKPGARIKVQAFTVRASATQARRWVRVARFLGCRSVSAWLEELADEQARRVEELIEQG